MKDLVTYIAKTVADKFANITDNNEMFSEARKQEPTPQEHEEAKKRRIEDIEAQIKALQDELAQIKASDKGEKLEDIEKKAKRKAAAKNAVATKKKNKAPWCIYNGKEYAILDQNETMMKLTDGIIHFWVNKDATE